MKGMPYIKKLVMRGFKSFAPETSINFENAMNCVVGPNGAGKSNVTDAICFVLGRLSAKSMRAAKSANLIFAGTPLHKASPEATVKLVFDNSDKGFSIDAKEVEIERILRHNGQSIYKINGNVKTRQEVLELLAFTGIDPNGANIVLQGEIQSFVKMHAEERRQIIEEVAGISVYEARKEKSLHELEKTDEKLKEVSAILRERTAYLKNLEEERSQALKAKHLEETIKKCKSSILWKQIDEKKKEIRKIDDELEKREKIREKAKKSILEVQGKIHSLEEDINEINSHIQKSTGIEQETLHSQITSLKELLAGLSVRNENASRKLEEVLARRQRAETEIQSLETTVSELKNRSPLESKKQEELKKKKESIENLERDKRKFYSIKSDLLALKQRIEDKKNQLQRNKSESELLVAEIDKIGDSLKYKTPKSSHEALKSSREKVDSLSKQISELESKKLELEKGISVSESQIEEIDSIKVQVSKIDTCPLCKSKITPEHLKHVYSDCDEKVSKISSILKESRVSLAELASQIKKLKLALEESKVQITTIEIESVKLNNINSQTETIKRLEKDRVSLEKEVSELTKEKEKREQMQEKFKYSEEKYEQTLLEIEEISARTEQNLDMELEFKVRELEKTRLIIKQSQRDEEELGLELKEYEREISEKSSLLEEKELQEKELQEKFQKLFDERVALQKNIQESNSIMITKQAELQMQENETNNIRINKARVDAEKSTLEVDYSIFKDSEILQGSIELLKDKLAKSEESLRTIGNVNMRALEVYDEIKKEYDSIAIKAEQLNKEKLEILKIIEEIDIKKKRTFMKTLSSINEIFTRNFMQLSTKGQAFMDLENKEDPFAAGLDIIIKVGKGKYFDVTSLSGGEQTLVALSLIFAIQEYKPYSFYIFDEVDAALDKRNSERLASLIKKHMKSGQYIVVTHNDALMTESGVLYGVTMQDGISKIISLQV